MAKSDDNLFTQGTRGTVGKQIVYKQINGKTFIAKYPDMSGVKYNATQQSYQSLFSLAVEYARAVLRDPVRKQAYEKKIRDNKKLRERSIYHVAIWDFMKKFSNKVPKSEVLSMLQKCREAYKLTDRQEKVIKHLIAQKNLTNAIYQQLAGVSKPTATRDLQNLVKQGAILLQSHGAGAHYSLVPFENEIDEDEEDDDCYEGLIGSWPRENGSEQSKNGSSEQIIGSSIILPGQEIQTK